MALLRVLFSPKGRRWIYSVLVAAIPLLVLYGVTTEEEALLWSAVLAAVLGNVTALTHIQHTTESTGKHVRGMGESAPEHTGGNHETGLGSLAAEPDRKEP